MDQGSYGGAKVSVNLSLSGRKNLDKNREGESKKFYKDMIMKIFLSIILTQTFYHKTGIFKSQPLSILLIDLI